MIGQLIDGRYRIQSLLGRGQMGVVYAALDQHTSQDVALKFLMIKGDRKSALKRFFRGARLARSVRHKHVVHTLDYGVSTTQDGAAYLVMELVRGVPLTSFMGAHLPVSARVGLVTQLLQALAHLHARNVLHRDIKPDNVLITRNPNGVLNSQITDFGIASGIESEPTDIRGDSQHLVIGTPAYMAPERASELGAAKPSSDLYSVGVILYELIAGHLPFDGNPIEVLVRKNRFAADPIVPNPSTPEGLIKVVMKLLEREPNRRYQHAIDALKDLMPFADEPFSGVMPISSQEMLAATVDVSSLDASATVLEELDSEFASHRLSNPFLWGRESILDSFEKQVSRVESGVGQFVILEGGMGMGLDAIMEHMSLQVAETGQCQVLRGNFLELAGAESGLRQALEEYLGSHGLDRDDVAQLIRLHLERHAANTDMEANALLQFLRPTRSSTAFVQGNQNAIFALFFRTLRRIAMDRPIFLALGQFHRGAELSAAFLEYACFELSFRQFPIFICATRESAGLEDALGMVLQKVEADKSQVCTHLSVEPVDTEILAEGLRTHFDIDADAAYNLAGRAGGSPLLACQLADIFVEQTIHRDELSEHSSVTDSWNNPFGDGRLTLTPALSNVLARSVDVKLRHRSQREHLCALIEVTAILGPAVEYSLLAEAADEHLPPETFEYLLSELVQMEILVSEGSAGQERFSLYPPVLRDYYLEDIAPERARELHHSCIRAYLNLWPSEAAPISGVLGDHYAGAGDDRKAVNAWLDAFDFQFEHGDPLRAVHWGLKVTDILGAEDDRSVECVLKTGRLLLDMGELERAAEVLTPLQSHPDVDTVMRSGEVLSDVYENQGNSVAWNALKVHLDHLLPSASPHGQRAYLRMRSIFENSYGRARAGLSDAVRALDGAPTGQEAQRAAQRAAFCCLAMGNPRSGVPFAERALSESGDNPQLKVRSLRALGTVYTWLGDGVKAVSAHENALDVAHQYGLYARIPIAYHDLGDAHRMNKNGHAASQAYDVALHNAARLDLGHTRELVRVKQVMCRLTERDTHGVVDELQLLAPVALRAGLGLAIPFCRLLEAWAWCLEENWTSCLETLQLIDDLSAVAVDPQIPNIIEDVARGLNRAQEWREAARLFLTASALWNRQEDLVAAHRCQRDYDAAVKRLG